ncbi:MAG: uroporphyrinogen-III synthase [Steroidobacteraceae bacterium]|jgi:uroporphyrinogen-III synthase
MEPAPADALAGRVIAVPESRELQVFAGLLERRGATVLRYPLVSIVDAPDPRPVLAWLRSFSEGSCDDLILLTGEGLRRLLRCLEQHAPQERAAFVAALARTRRITRGPKPARALRELGLLPDLEAAPATSAGVISVLREQPLAGRRVGLQLYGSAPNPELLSFLQGAAASVLSVAPYAYADSIDDGAVQELLARMQRGEVDAIAFTSTPQVERLFRVADEVLVRAALAATSVAAVGPVVAATLAAHGVNVQAMPGQSWFLKPLTAELSRLLEMRSGTEPLPPQP